MPKAKKLSPKDLEAKLSLDRKNIWPTFNPATTKKVFAFAEEYKTFLNANRTERHCVRWAEKLLVKQGFKDLSTFKPGTAKPGQKFYTTFRNKVITAGIFGKDVLTKGINLLLTHIDAPRVDLKPYPLYEDERLALLKTHYYGGIKKYQWASIPLSMHGVVAKKDGTTVEIHIGDKPGDPQLTISDLLPHLAKQQMARKGKDIITGEEMNVIVGSIPSTDKQVKKAVKFTVLEYLYTNYGIDEEDLISSEITLVPSIPVSDIGFDRGMIGGYGHDDRICSFAAMQALLTAKPMKKTAITVWIDREEIGSIGDTGANSTFIRMLFGKIAQASLKTMNEEVLKDIFYNSEAISGDVTGGMDPSFKSVAEPINAPRINEGVVIHRYSGHGGKYYTSEASAEFTGKVRKTFNQAGVPWQSGELGKIDEGGGGTIAQYINYHGIQILDIGPPILNMHSPFELVSKADLYATYLGYKAFIEEA